MMEPNVDHDAVAAAAIVGADVAANHNEGADEAVDDDDEEQQTANERTLINKAILILQERLEFPWRTQNKIVELAQQFVDGVGEDIHDMITDVRTIEDGYEGLDSDRDTEIEVEKAIRYYPESLTRRGGKFNDVPCHCLPIMVDNTTNKIEVNVKAASFVHLFVRLAIEFNSFEEDARGGLLAEDASGDTGLYWLMRCSHQSYEEDHQRNVDTACLAVLLRLRQSGLFKKEDIQQYNLVHDVCRQINFSEHRFRFLTEWFPESLLQTDDEHGATPLHWAANSDQAFRVVLDAVFRYYPRWRGINMLFQKRIDDGNTTPFKVACQKITRNTAMHIVEETLIRYSTTQPINIPYALILAATDDRIHLNCLYFLTRRHPDAMLGMLRQRSGTMISTSSTTINNHNDSNGTSNIVSNNTDDNTAGLGEDASTNDNNNVLLRRSTRKRKRTNKN